MKKISDLVDAKQIIGGDIVEAAEIDQLVVVELKHAVFKAAVLLLRHIHHLCHLRLRVARDLATFPEPCAHARF